MGSSSFENLAVYQLAERLADEVWELVLQWPRLAQDTVGKQLIRACDSIGANIAEGSGKGTYADNRRYVRVARGSLYESRHWLRRAFRRKLLTPDQADRLRPLLESWVLVSTPTSDPLGVPHGPSIRKTPQVTNDQ